MTDDEAIVLKRENERLRRYVEQLEAVVRISAPTIIGLNRAAINGRA